MTDTDQAQNDASDATAALIREHAAEIGDLRAQLARTEERSIAWRAKAEDVTKEVNDLRAQLMEALLSNERLRGYIEGKREGEPPRMVPERQRTPEWADHGPPVTPRSSMFAREAPKPWFAR